MFFEREIKNGSEMFDNIWLGRLRLSSNGGDTNWRVEVNGKRALDMSKKIYYQRKGESTFKNNSDKWIMWYKLKLQ